jgi:tetratricopeptide (TPR) repeat protein
MRRVLVFLCVFVFSASAFASGLPGEMLSFADSLFQRGDYYRAITEYERVLFFHPGHQAAKTARYQIALSYLKGDRIDQAVSRFRSIAEEYGNEELGRKALFMVGEAYYQKADHAKAKEAFVSFLDSYPLDERADDARLRIGWSSLRRGDWRQAEAEFLKVPAGSRLYEEARGLAESAKLYPGIPKKSPSLAGGLSAVLPGSGQLYAGRPGDAAASFLLNGAFIWAAAEAFQNDNNVTGGILAFFEAGWYLGNIYNAMGSVHKYNRRMEQEYLKEMQSRYSLSYSRSRSGHLLAFTLKF